MKKLIYIGLLSTLLLTACGEETEEVVEEVDYNDVPVEELKTPPEDSAVYDENSLANQSKEKEEVVNIDWKSEITTIINSDGTETEKFDAVMALAGQYMTNQKEAEQFREEIISEFENGNYLKDITNDEYMLTMIFKTRIVETYYLFQTNAIKDFAFDMHQNLKYTYRGVDAVDSESVKSNEEQMNKTLTEIK